MPKLQTVPKMNYPAYSVDCTRKKMRFDHLKGLSLRMIDASAIRLVIRIDAYALQATLETRLGPLPTPIAACPGSEKEQIHVCRMNAELQTQNDIDLRKQLQRWIDFESAPTLRSERVVRVVEGQKAFTILKQTTKWIPNENIFASGIL